LARSKILRSGHRSNRYPDWPARSAGTRGPWPRPISL